MSEHVLGENSAYFMLKFGPLSPEYQGMVDRRMELTGADSKITMLMTESAEDRPFRAGGGGGACSHTEEVEVKGNTCRIMLKFSDKSANVTERTIAI
jgi:hypothetical protein